MVSSNQYLVRAATTALVYLAILCKIIKSRSAAITFYYYKLYFNYRTYLQPPRLKI